MLTCPHCKKKGIGVWAKLWSGSYTTAQCTLCGRSYCIRQKVKQAFCALRYVAGLTFFFAALLSNPAISLVAYAVFLVVLELILLSMGNLKEEPSLKKHK